MNIDLPGQPPAAAAITAAPHARPTSALHGRFWFVITNALAFAPLGGGAPGTLRGLPALGAGALLAAVAIVAIVGWALVLSVMLVSVSVLLTGAFDAVTPLVALARPVLNAAAAVVATTAMLLVAYAAANVARDC